jgi:hypothetical protein
MVGNIPKSLSLTLVIMNGQVAWAFWNILGKQGVQVGPPVHEEDSKKPLAYYSWPCEYSHCQGSLFISFFE